MPNETARTMPTGIGMAPIRPSQSKVDREMSGDPELKNPPASSGAEIDASRFASNESRRRIDEFSREHRTALLVMLFTDMVDSTRLKQELGDAAALELIEKHHRIVRETLRQFREAAEVDTAGDSFFCVFLRASDAVRFALRLQHQLRTGLADAPVPVRDRIGVHLGEVHAGEPADGVKTFDVLGLQVDTAARVMSLGQGDQLLLTRSVFDNARPILRGVELPGLAPLEWLNHGRYVLKGVEDPIEICEVGESGAASLSPPPDTEKARREVLPGEEVVLGWRPACEQDVPNAAGWRLVEKLGEGSFGEVWTAQHDRTKEVHVFKFCFDPEKVRGLKRELALFRLLREQVGEHPNVVRLFNVYLDEPPFFLEMEHVPGENLANFVEARGGAGQVPLETRLEIVAQTADGLQAAADAGIIHRDLKPSNILVHQTPEGLTVKLSDFGVGQVTDAARVAGMTQMTGVFETADSSSRAGTPMYLAPEVVEGRSASTRSDL